ncbi:MAG: OmpA family protein [Spirochaetota bacterium]
MKSILLAFLLCSTLYSQELRNFSQPRFGSPLNTQNVEYNPVISPNSRYIVFQSNRPDGKGGMDIWLAENRNYRDRTGIPEWMNLTNFSELNSPSYEGGFSIRFDAEGNPDEIFFTSDRGQVSDRNGYKDLNIYYTKRNTKTNRWSSPRHLGEVNTNFDDKMPAISPEGDVLVFSSNRPGGFGGSDLWVSYRDLKSGVWKEPVNLGKEINSTANEIMPYFHYDGLSIFFSSDRNSPSYKYSVYLANKKGVGYFIDASKYTPTAKSKYPSKNPVNRESLVFHEVLKLGAPFNTRNDDEGFSLSHDGLWVYYSSNRPGGNGQFDIYRSQVPEELRKFYPFELWGFVLDGSEGSMIGLDATIQISDPRGVVKIITSKRIGGDLQGFSDTPRYNFRTILRTGSLYRLHFSSPGFHPNEIKLDLRGNVGRKKQKYLKVVLRPVQAIANENPDGQNPQKDGNGSKKTSSEEGITVVLKDFKTKETLSKGSVTLFTEALKDGKALSKKDGKFSLEKIPKADFELLGRAIGYKDDTMILRYDPKLDRSGQELTIYLKKIQDVEKIYKTTLFFDFNSHEITKKHKVILDEMAEYLKKNPKDRMEIRGHTDNVASKKFNVWLSNKRSVSVQNYLVAKGIDKVRLPMRALWYSQPIASNKTDEGRAKNRRVNFKKLE